jgi:predicted RNA-binding Zn-ribbon protein involved in translation (DUF1610 family)
MAKAKVSERQVKYQKNLKKGLCPRCGKKSKEFTYCGDCRAYFRNYNNEKSEEINEARKDKYAERKANRQCPRCGVKHRKSYTKIMCADCLEKQYNYNSR